MSDDFIPTYALPDYIKDMIKNIPIAIEYIKQLDTKTQIERLRGMREVLHENASEMRHAVSFGVLEPVVYRSLLASLTNRLNNLEYTDKVKQRQEARNRFDPNQPT